jgi:hypothetical protein
MISEPTFIASVNGLCGFILVVGDREVDAFTPSGEWLGVFHDRIDAAEAVLQRTPCVIAGRSLFPRPCRRSVRAGRDVSI